MSYATVADLRAEGITETQATDERLQALIEEAGLMIDNICGWFFEPRQLTLKLDGRGTRSIEPPYPLIVAMSLAVNGADHTSALSEVINVGAPILPGFVAPRIAWRAERGWIFPKGEGNVEIRGWWGYTESGGAGNRGRTPLVIKRACMMLVMRLLPPLGDTDEVNDVRNQWRIVEEKTRDQTIKLATPVAALSVTGDPDIDAILLRYRRPSGLGAV